MSISKSRPIIRKGKHDRKFAAVKPHYIPAPVFIISPSPRCGTNYLAQTLLLDPIFQIPDLLWEDHVLIHSDLLNKYAYQTSLWWEKESSNDEFRNKLMRHLGDGILSFLGENIDEGRQLLCKTPRAINIENFFPLFPNAKLLVLVRDGRDVTESAVKSWPNRRFAFERSARTWATGARSIIEFMSGANSKLRGRSWELVHYEDLFKDPLATVKKLATLLDIDIKSFDPSQINNINLYGSSTHFGNKNKINWEPVSKPKDFQPLGKWKSWNPWKRLMFNAIAGRELIELGYLDGAS
jgi:hypothetical protein